MYDLSADAQRFAAIVHICIDEKQVCDLSADAQRVAATGQSTTVNDGASKPTPSNCGCTSCSLGVSKPTENVTLTENHQVCALPSSSL